jgi:hypothetical protein
MPGWRARARPSVAESGGIWVPPGGSADPQRETQDEPQPEPSPVEITPEELLEQIRQLKVSDVLLSTLTTVAQLAYAKLEPASRDLEQARLAIEAMRALVPVLEGAVPDDVLESFRSVISNLQLAYVDAAGESE